MARGCSGRGGSCAPPHPRRRRLWWRRRACASQCATLFTAISCALRHIEAPPPPPPCREGEGGCTGAGEVLGGSSAFLPPPPHSFLRPFRRLKRRSLRRAWARACWSGPVTRHGCPLATTPPPPPPPAPASTGAAGGIEESGATTPHAVPVRRAQSPRMQVVPGHNGVRHCYFWHHEGHSWLVPAAGVRDSTRCSGWEACARPAPPPGGGGGGANEEMASQRSGAESASTGRSGDPSWAHGRAEGEDT